MHIAGDDARHIRNGFAALPLQRIGLQHQRKAAQGLDPAANETSVRVDGFSKTSAMVFRAAPPDEKEIF